MRYTEINRQQRGKDDDMEAQLTLTDTTPAMTIDEWVEQFGEMPFELIDGEKIPMSPSVFGSTRIANLLRDLMNETVKAKQLGEVYIELSIAFVDGSEWVKSSLIPDIAFVSNEQLAAFRTRYPQDWRKRPLSVIPDLVAEIVSPTDRHADVRRKVTRYLEEGVRLVWVIDYLNEVVAVFTAQGGHELRKTDKLTAGDVLPGFELALETLFT